jgi:hypothetical protein
MSSIKLVVKMRRFQRLVLTETESRDCREWRGFRSKGKSTPANHLNRRKGKGEMRPWYTKGHSGKWSRGQTCRREKIREYRRGNEAQTIPCTSGKWRGWGRRKDKRMQEQ